MEASHQEKHSATLSLPCCDEAHTKATQRDRGPAASAVHAAVTAMRVKPSSACSPCRHHTEQKSHLAEPCPDYRITRNNQWLLFKLLSLSGHLLPGIDNWDIFIYTFLHNLCSPEKEKDSSRLFRAHSCLAPVDFSRFFYHLTLQLLNVSVLYTPISMILVVLSTLPEGSVALPPPQLTHHLHIELFPLKGLAQE